MDRALLHQVDGDLEYLLLEILPPPDRKGSLSVDGAKFVYELT